MKIICEKEKIIKALNSVTKACAEQRAGYQWKAL